MFPGSPPLPRGYSLASTFKLFFDRGERPIAIPRALLAWYFHFWCRFASYGGNDLWPARFVLGSASNQGDNHDRSCWCSFFSFLRKIFLGLVRVFLGSCWCSMDEAWRWWIGERRTKSRRIIFQNERWKNSSLSSCWFELELHISWNLVIFLLRIRTAKCAVQTYFFFFTSIPHREICRFPKCIATCLEKAREQFFIPKDRRKRSTPRQRERISVWNRREIWQDGWFPRSWARNVEGAIVSRNGNHRHQRDVKEFLAVSGLRVERRSGQFRPRGKIWKFDRNY